MYVFSLHLCLCTTCVPDARGGEVVSLHGCWKLNPDPFSISALNPLQKCSILKSKTTNLSKQKAKSQACWYTTRTLALGRLRQDHHEYEFEDSLGV